MGHAQWWYDIVQAKEKPHEFCEWQRMPGIFVNYACWFCWHQFNNGQSCFYVGTDVQSSSGTTSNCQILAFRSKKRSQSCAYVYTTHCRAKITGTKQTVDGYFFVFVFFVFFVFVVIVVIVVIATMDYSSKNNTYCSTILAILDNNHRHGNERRSNKQ